MSVKNQKKSKSLMLVIASVIAIAGLLIIWIVTDSWLDHEDDRLIKPSQDQLRVVTSIYPLADMTRQIVGDQGMVAELVPNTADPHTYSPSPEDILNLNQADVLIYLGNDQEPWMRSLLNGVNNPNLVVIDLGQLNSELVEDDRLDSHDGEDNHVEHGEHGDEFHYWLDFDVARQVVQMTALELSKTSPELAERFAENGQKEQAKWAELDEKYRLGLQNCQTRTVVYAGHSAFEQLAKKYDLNWLDALSVSSDAELTPQTLANLIQTLQTEKSRAIFTDAFFSPKLAETMAEESGLPVLRLNPGERWGSENGQYQEGGLRGIMEANLEKLREGLGCE